MTFWKKDF